MSAHEQLGRHGSSSEGSGCRAPVSHTPSREREEYERLLAVLPAAMYTCDASGVITYYNEKAAELWGRRPELGDTDQRFCGSFRLYRPDGTLLPHAETPMARALRDGSSARGEEVAIERPDGSRIHVSVNIDALRDENGRVVGAINVFSDITRQHRAETARAYLAAIVDSSDDVIVSKRLDDGRITSWNAAAERVFGYTAEEAIGQHITLIIPPELHEEEASILARLRRGERIEHFETVRVAKDGRRLDIALTVSPVKDQHGRIIGASKVARDITARKREQRTLREREQQLALVIDTAPTLIAHCDRNGRLRLANRAYAERLGLRAEDLPGRRLEDVLGPDAYDRIRPHVDRALKGEKVEFETELTLPGRPSHYVHARYAPEFGPDGAVSGFVAVIEDITGRKRAEQALARELEATRTLQRVSTRLLDADEGDATLYQDLVEAATELVGADMGSLQRYDEVTDRLILLASKGLDKELAAEFEAVGRDAGTTCAEALERGERVLVRDYGSDPGLAGTAAARAHLEAGVAASQSTPLVSRSGRLVGMISTHWSQPHAPQEGSLRFLDVLARQAADVLERARARQAVREGEERFRTLADNMSQFAWMADPTGWIFWYNRRWYEYTGTTFDEMQGWGWTQVHHPEHVERVRAKFKSHVDAGKTWEDIFPLRGRDGEYRWFLSRAVPIRDESGEIVRWFGTNTDVTEHRRAEQALRESEERFRRIADAMPQLVWTAEPDGSVDYYNVRVQQYEKFELDPATQRWNWQPCLHPDDRDRTVAAWRQAVETGAEYHIEHRVRRRARESEAQGEYRWLLSRAVPVRDGTGAVLKWYGTGTDIHDLKQAEAALRESEERLLLAKRAAQLGVYDHDIAADRLDWDDRLRELWGLDDNEPVDFQAFLDGLHPDDRQATADAIRTALDPERGGAYEARYRIVHRKTGEIRWIEAIGQASFENGKPVRLVGTVQDISREVEAESALRESEQRFRRMADTAPAMLWVTDSSHRCTFVSHGWEEFTGQAVEKGLGTGWSDMVHAADRAEMQRTFSAAAARREPFQMEYRLRHVRGGYRWVLDAARPRINSRGEFEGYIGSVFDITDRRNAEEELRQAHSELERRVADRTRELQLQTEHLRALAGELASAEQRERKRLAGILHDDLQQWLVAAKMRLGPLSPETVDEKFADVPAKVREMLDEAIRCSRSLSQELRPPVLYEEGLVPALRWLAEQMLERHDLRVEVVADDGEIELSDDFRALLFESARELLFNTVKHAGVSAACIRVARRGDSLHLSVEDEGDGFDVQAASKRAGKGLGLFSVRERLVGLGGKMEIESQPGKGARITLRAPITEACAAPAETLPDIETKAVGRVARLLGKRRG